MRIAVIADVVMQKEFETKALPENVEVHYATSITEVIRNADIYFYLLDEDDLIKDLNHLQTLQRPVFANAVITVLTKLPQQFIRINSWPTFFKRNIVELSLLLQDEELVKNILQQLNLHYQIVADVPGFITARTIAMIINEAYFALGDEVSSKADIDIAMKLGTNYPFGPFEWSEKIGLKKVYNLLSELSKTDERYIVAPALLKEIK